MTRTTRKLFAKVLTGSACLIPLAAAPDAVAQERPGTEPVARQAAAPPAAPMTSKQLHQHLARGSGWIQNRNAKGLFHGTGWIVDLDKKLMVTNDHVVEGSDTVQVQFPVWKDGKLVCEEATYQDAPRVRGVVIDRDANRDLALVKLDAIPAGMHALKIATTELDEGDDLRLIGAFTNGGDGLVWGAVSGMVRTVGPQNGNRFGKVRHVLSNADTNGGNSGSAVVNMAGEVVAVHAAVKLKAHNVAMHVAASELNAFLAEALPGADPRTAAELLTRGKRRLDAGRPDVAVADFSAALAKDDKLAEALFLRGKAFVAKGDPRTGLEDLNAALDLERGNYDFRVGRGAALRATGKLDESVADFSAAIRTDPSRSAAYNERGISHLNAKRFDEAEADYTRAIDLSGSDAVLYANRADARVELKKFDAAAADWAKAAHLAPWNAWYPNELGFALMGLGKFEEARAAFARAAEVSGGHPKYLTNLGDALRLTGDFKGAAKAYTDAIKSWGEKGPPAQVAASYAGRGMANRELKANRDAVEDLTRAIDLTGGKVAWHFAERALAHKAAGAENAAADDMATAAKLDPKFGTAAVTDKGKDTPDAKALNLVGTWRGSVVVNGVKIAHVISFDADGTLAVTGTTSTQYGILERVSDTGTWKLSGTRLTLRCKDTGTVVRKVNPNGADEIDVELEEIGRTMTFTREK